MSAEYISIATRPCQEGALLAQVGARPAVDASSMPRMEDAPPLYKPELIEPKKRLTILQRCYKEPWVPIGQHAALSNLRLPPSAPARCSETGVPCPWQAA